MANRDILQFAPPTWDTYSNNTRFKLNHSTLEFREIQDDLVRAVQNVQQVRNLERIQIVHDFGQFLLRGQILVIENVPARYYNVRRYIAIPDNVVDKALEYNLDSRRLAGVGTIIFKSHISNVSPRETVFVVRAITTEPNSTSIRPSMSTEYYIEYIAKVN